MIRIALKMLLGDRIKYAGVIFGIAFASLLITQLLSIFAGIMDRTHALVTDVGQADVWVTDPAVEYVDEVANLPETALSRVRGVQGVKWAVPMYTGTLRARLAGGRYRAVQVIGLDDATLLGGPPKMIHGELADLRKTDAVIVDDKGADGLLAVPMSGDPRTLNLGGPRRPLTVGDEFFINDQRVVTVGIAHVSPRFINRPAVYTTYTRALKLSPLERNLLSFVLVGVAPGKDPAEVARTIEAETGLKARTAQKMAADTRAYIERNTDIVNQIGIMVLLGTIVGLAISGQLLYLFTHDNIRHYAALIAMGTQPKTILAMVASQAALAGAVGYGVGLGLCAIGGEMLVRAGMPFRLTATTPVIVGIVIVAICVIAALISGRKVLTTDAAIVFKA